MTERGGIVWLASFPKSGNTWFRALLANLDAGEDGPVDINTLSLLGTIASDRREFEEATLIDSRLLFHDDIDSLRPRIYEKLPGMLGERCWVKVHDAYTLTTSGEPMFGCGVASAVVYLVRDPRDVVVSLTRHYDFAIDKSIEFLSSGKGTLLGHLQFRQKLLGWSGHVTSWLDQRDVPVHVVRYEDLVAAPGEGFAAALAFVGQPAAPADIERAVRHSDLAELQRQERTNGFRERMSRTEPFFHSGKVGAWRRHLTEEQVRAIVDRHGDVMTRLGYEL